MTKTQDRLKIRQQRTMTYFIEAANQIIKEEGIEAVTIRKTADLAGYASATLYNYFDNLTHLIFLATMNYLEEYNAALPQRLTECENSVERYMAVCKCFSEYAYEDPEIYEHLFFSHGDEKLEEYMHQYYELFPEKVILDWPEPLNKIFQINNIYSRSSMMLTDCVNDGYMTEDAAKDFNEVNMMIFKCILQDVRDDLLSKDQAIEKTMKYYRQIFEHYLKPEFTGLLDTPVCH
ncbi:TetR/AcrR family transcriptional regulator [Desulfobaculum bizertense]|uniref:Transcriptional regulator, TetR family n=1 Tax=Desulfobaculum bizertense DSM 18034 TaxID=1121442 RepID=A0A1T4VQ33_9BACT|nr:TetR/AcrR family transcriptional regulator [Desulfobaculum bizertense]UIJ38251.1 TetR/AcrR family transcriptional regulator [Desulfobaculum bizertense]SKA66985.1 transcriptional regulator, TetR family [Desulfobaculum bizertense DSM 18034]